jgi:hypothetical protein
MAIAESSKEVGYEEEAMLVSTPTSLTETQNIVLLWLLLRATRRWDMGRRRCLLVRPTSHTLTLIYFYLQRHGYC